MTQKPRARLRALPGARELPKHPYRDSALVYGGLALVIVVLAWATEGSLVKAVLFAAAFFLVAMSWSWTRWRRELREDARRRAARERVRGS